MRNLYIIILEGNNTTATTNINVRVDEEFKKSAVYDYHKNRVDIIEYNQRKFEFDCYNYFYIMKLNNLNK